MLETLSSPQYSERVTRIIGLYRLQAEGKRRFSELDTPCSTPTAMLDGLTTESRNPASTDLDRLSALDIVKLINAEDAIVATAVGAESTAIARAIDVASERLAEGGRIVYFGAGTSGRLGVLDAAECPPTFSADPRQVVGIIAGGEGALREAVEGVEDSLSQAEIDLRRHGLSAADVAIGIATSGRTPYVLGGLKYAREAGAYTVALTCNRNALATDHADLCITPIVGPEVISGSTRMKAGTATKMVLNMISTGVMVKLGKTFGNLMVDLKQSNSKLTARAQRIVSETTGLEASEALEQLELCEGQVKTAIVAWHANISPEQARVAVERAGGHVGKALDTLGATDKPTG